MSQCSYLMERKYTMQGPPVNLVIKAHFNDNALHLSGVSSAKSIHESTVNKMLAWRKQEKHKDEMVVPSLNQVFFIRVVKL